MKAALLKNINKILIPLFALTLVSCGESTDNSIVEPKNLGKEVDTKTIIVEGRQVTFKYGMNNEELYNAVSNFVIPGYLDLTKENNNFEFEVSGSSDISYSAKGRFRICLDADNAKYLALTTSCGNISHFYTQRSKPGQMYTYSLNNSELIYIYGMDAGEPCIYANNEVDNDKASENKDYVHADKCFYNYNTYFYDSFNDVVVSNESDTFEFGVQVSYKITENYLIVETNRPHGIYSQYGYEDLDLFDLCLEAINRDDLFYKQIHYYNFKTGLLEYQGLSMKSITCNYKLGSEISLEGRISFVKPNNDAMKLHNKIAKYVKSNTEQISLDD